MEKDDAVRGEGNALEFGGRSIYDPRLGKFISVDPWTNRYAWQSPYAYYRNTPISIVDYKGLGGGGASGSVQATTQDANYSRDNTITLDLADEVELMLVVRQQKKDYNTKIIGYHRGKPYTQADLDSDKELHESLGRNQAVDRKPDLSDSPQGFTTVVLQDQMLRLGFPGYDVFVREINGEDVANWEYGLEIVSIVPVFKIAKLGKVAIKSSKYAGRSKSMLADYIDRTLIQVGKKRPYVVSAVTDEATGDVYIGYVRGVKSADDLHPTYKKYIENMKQVEGWSLHNCAECDAINQALKNGAKWDDLIDSHTMKWDNDLNKYVDFERCDNCAQLNNVKPTSDKVKGK